MALDRNQFIKRFVEECGENVSRLADGLLTLSGASSDQETINQLFRAAHTIKGSSRMLKLVAISRFAHGIEEILDGLRQGRISFSQDLLTVIFQGTDEIRQHLTRLSAGQETAEVNEDILALLEQAAKGVLPRLAHADQEPGKPTKPVSEKSKVIIDMPQPKEKRETIRVAVDKLDNIINMAGELANIRFRIHRRALEVEQIEKKINLYGKQISTFDGLGDSRPGSAPNPAALLVLLHNSIQELKKVVREDDAIVQALTDELEGRALDLRMLPLDTIFQSYQRAVRDMALSLEKDVRLEITGGETELDKKIIDRINDPLVHMIRNCLDHGIETPEERIKAGKLPTGRISISAQHQGQFVVIEVSDDGAGIPVEKLRHKAVQKKLYSPTQIDSLSDSEVIQLIYEPGFTTSELVTDISGRGVGMDVVRRIIMDDLKGTVEIRTQPSLGTTITIRLPATMAIVKVLLIGVAGVTYAVSSGNVLEIIKIPVADLISIGDRIAFRLREQIIPTIALNDITGKSRKTDPNRLDVLILIVRAGDQQAGIFIDELIEESGMLVKPLPYYLKKNQWVSGAIMSGKDTVVSLLHIPNIVRTLKEKRAMSRPDDQMPAARAIRILVVDDSISTREIEKSILEAHGYEVLLAGDGMEAMESLKKQTFDLVVTDVEMPRMDGFTLTQKIRQEENHKDIPVILVTSRDKEADKKRGLQVGANAYIVKGSFEQDQLLDTIKALTI